MKIEDIKFLNNRAYLLQQCTISASKIEKTLGLFHYSGQGNTIDQETENSNIPYFATAFFFHVFLYNQIPDEHQLIQTYLELNKIEADNGFYLINSKKLPIWGVKNRLLRAYPSLIRDFHFFKLCTEFDRFDAVHYSLTNDIEKGIDLIIEKDQKKFCVAIYTNTNRAKYFKYRKNNFRHSYKGCFKNIELAIDLKSKKMKKVSNFLLLSDAHVIDLWSKINYFLNKNPDPIGKSK